MLGNEGLPDFPAFFHPDRNILQVRIDGTQSAGLRQCLLVARMDLSGFRFDEFQESFHVGRLQFGQLSVIQDVLHDRRLRLQFFQYIHRCRIACFRLFDGWQAHLLEQDDTQLLR
ncbi:hypothetical protein SDC9_56823 [bioreactor metagenome]|uniref:Uncharacterized protein n=1 Tax=bioreactor metagenome TaxID=1076179 RepID=A0A644X3M9_9ZZZZ